MDFELAVKDYVEKLTHNKYKQLANRAVKRFGAKKPIESDFEAYRLELTESGNYTGENARDNINTCVTQARRLYEYLEKEGIFEMQEQSKNVKNQKARVNFLLDSEKYEDLKTLARISNTTISEILSNLIMPFLLDNAAAIEAEKNRRYEIIYRNDR